MIGVADIDCPSESGGSVEFTVEIPTGDTGDLAVVGRVETDTFINERMSSASPVAAVDGGSSSGHDIVIAATAGPDAPPDEGGPPDTGTPEPPPPG